MASITLSTLWSRYLTSLITTTTKMCQKNPINLLCARRSAAYMTADLLAFSISYINHWYKNKIRTHSHRESSSDYAVLVTRAGIEPTLTAWEAAVLTAWPTGHIKREVGIYPFSQAVSSQLSSARVSLTSVFGMGTGGTSPSSTPTVSFFWGYTLKTEYRTALANRVSYKDGVKPSTY